MNTERYGLYVCVCPTITTLHFRPRVKPLPYRLMEATNGWARNKAVYCHGHGRRGPHQSSPTSLNIGGS